MKTSKRNKLLGLALTGGFSLFGASNALAAAGDDILNRATLSYDVGLLPQTIIESSQAGNSNPGLGNGGDTLFKEDRVINFIVAETDGATISVTPSATVQVQTFSITNNGNDVQDFLFLARNRLTGTNDPHSANLDNFDVTGELVFVDTNANGTYEAGTDTDLFADELAVGASISVFIVSTIPDNVTVSNGDIAVMALVSQVAQGGGAAVEGTAVNNDDNGNVSPGGTYSNTGTVVAAGTINDIVDDPATVETVFNDPAGTIDSAGNAGATSIGQTSADHSYTVAAADITVTKTSAALWDPVNNASNPKSFPGAYVTYTIAVVNAAAGADADLTTLSDVLPATLDLDPDFVVNDGTTPTNALGDSIEVTKGATTIYCTATADGDGCDYTGGAGGTVTVDLSNAAFAGIMPLAATETVTINFNVIVQ